MTSRNSNWAAPVAMIRACLYLNGFTQNRCRFFSGDFHHLLLVDIETLDLHVVVTSWLGSRK